MGDELWEQVAGWVLVRLLGVVLSEMGRQLLEGVADRDDSSL